MHNARPHARGLPISRPAVHPGARTLANTAFAVKCTRAEGSVDLAATAPTIAGKTVTLTLAAEVEATDTAVKVSYTRPTQGTNNRIADAQGNESVTGPGTPPGAYSGLNPA